MLNFLGTKVKVLRYTKALNHYDKNSKEQKNKVVNSKDIFGNIKYIQWYIKIKLGSFL